VSVKVDGMREVDGAHVLDYQYGPFGAGRGGGAADWDDVVRSGEDGFVVEDVHHGGLLPVEDEARGVDGPLEDGAGGEAEIFKDEVGGGDVGDVEGKVGDCGGEGLVKAVSGGGDGGVGGGGGGRGGVIPDDACDGGDVGIGRAAVDPAAAEPVFGEGGGGGFGFNDDVVALPDGDLDAVGGIVPDGDEVVGDDGEAVAVDAELKDAVDGDVDEAEEIFLAGLEDHFELLAAANALGVSGAGAVEGVGAVDQAALKGRGTAKLRDVPSVESFDMRPVLEEESTEVLVVVPVCWAVEYYATEEALRVLQTEVAVVPRRAILRGPEFICHAFTRGDGALSDSWNSVGQQRVELSHAMPMDSGSVADHVVGDVDFDRVTPVGDDGWTGDRSVECHACSAVAIRSAGTFLGR